MNSGIPVCTQGLQFQLQFHGWAADFHSWLKSRPTLPLNPINPDNARTFRITAAAGTELAGPFSDGTYNTGLTSPLLFPTKSSLQPGGPSSCTLLGWFRLASIDQYSSLLPPVGVWTVSQFQCGGPSSQNPYPSSSWWAVTPPTS